MISLILPSRGRPDKLQAALQSVVETMIAPENLEILVRLDSDDRDTLFVLDDIAKVHEETRFIIGPRYEGYASMASFWNELARIAQGEWLVTFNDDARMKEQGWDTALAEYNSGEIGFVAPLDNYSPDGRHCSFPILPRLIYKILGHITLFAGVDTWAHAMLEQTFVMHTAPAIRIEHQRPNIKGFEHLNDSTWEEAQASENIVCKDWSERSSYWTALVAEDIIKLEAFK